MPTFAQNAILPPPPAGPHCFNLQCIIGPFSTPICNQCARTTYRLKRRNFPSCGGPRPLALGEGLK